MAKKKLASRKPPKTTRVKRFDWSTYSLKSINLMKGSCSREGLHNGPLPKKIGTSITFMVRFPEHDPNSLVAYTTLALVCRYEDTDEPALEIDAVFCARYSFPRPVPDDTPNIQEFFRNYLCRHAWPYWRQYAQNAAVQMGLPRIPIEPMLGRDVIDRAEPERREFEIAD